MKKFKDISIKTKLILITIIVTLISLIFGFTAIVIYEYDKMKEDLENETRMSALLVGEFCATPLSFFDVSGAEEVLQKLDNIPFVKSAYVFDTDGYLFASYHNPDFKNQAKDHKDMIIAEKDTNYKSDEGLNVIKPITYKGNTYGTIWIVASYQKMETGLVNYFLMVGIILIIVSVISFFPASSLQAVISRPILELANLAKKISQKKDYTMRAKKYGDDEVGVLYDGFNTMLEQIEKRDKQRDVVEMALRESEENHRVLFETMVHGVIYYDANGNIMNANRAAEELFNMRIDNLKEIGLDLSHWTVVHENGKRFQNYEHPVWIALKTSRKVENVVMGIYNNKEKAYHWTMVSAIPIFDDREHNIRRVYTTFNDFTKRKLSEEEKEKLNKELLNKNKELEQIVYVTSHDLRSPLVNIQGFSNELKFSIQDLQQLADNIEMREKEQEKFNQIVDIEIPESMQFIETSIGKMDALLKGLLKLSRYGRVDLNIKLLDMNELVANVLKTYEFKIKEKNITIKKEQLPECYGDPDQINQVFSNIIGNAIKFLKNDIAGEIKISYSTKGKYNIYHISDNGIGIDKESQDKVFELFHRLDPTKTSGEGLGLTIVKKILERHGGKISLESKPGLGTTFFVSLLNKEF